MTSFLPSATPRDDGPSAAAAAAVNGILRDLDALTGDRTRRGVVVDSPPGAGKSTLVRRAAVALTQAGELVSIIAQTNNQIDDLIRGLSAAQPSLTIGRISSTDYLANTSPVGGLANVRLSNDISELADCALVIGTAAKWARVTGHHRPWAIVDEAYQMRSDALLLVASQFDQGLFVGDPGQLDPFTIVDTYRWTGLSYDPRQNAVDVLLNHNRKTVIERRLPVTWRLPATAAPLVSAAFYPYNGFVAGTTQEMRTLEFRTTGFRSPLDETLDMARRTGWAIHQLPARHTQRTDAETADATAALAARLLTRGVIGYCENHPGGRILTPADLAIGVVHRDQADQIRRSLAATNVPGYRDVAVDTANRLQGREFEIVIVAHPLSGRRDATAFHLEAGRLCVLMSRHRQACIIVTRAGITDLLDAHPTTDPVHLNVPVKFPDGWEAHHTVLERLEAHVITSMGVST
ncbi:AAA domain-containing protein [Spirillospora sp. CA-142024]|uniref:AAA domain-containing protein n=1 Tax=Spirillospora sp. CA-142024 TaxID=3240036 RepID=UPI003D901997